MKKRGQKRPLNYKQNRPWMENLQVVMQLGLTMAGSILLCFFIGLYLGKWIGFKGVFITIFTILGIIGGAVVTYRQIMEVFDTDNQTDQNNGND